jgi:hypothetical protein
MKRFGILLAAALATVTVAPSAMADTTMIETTTVSSPAFALPAGSSYIVVDPLTGKLFGDYSASVRIPSGYYVAERTSGRVVATTDLNGNLVAITAAPAPNVLVQIQERRAALQQQIADAIARNAVTVTEISPLRAALEQVAAQEVILRLNAGTVTFAQVAPLAYRLNVIGSQLTPVIKTTTAYTPLLGERVYVQGNQVLVATTDFAARRALLDQRIQFEYDAGRLTNNQVKELRADLAKVANLELRKTRDGSLSSSNIRSIERRFNELTEDMSESIAHTNKRRANIGLKVE